MEAVPGLDAAVAAARTIGMRFATASDDELLADGHAIEALGRLVDGWRIGFAAEAERRSSPKLGEQRLSFRQGVRDGIELVQLVAQVGHREAKQRVGLGSKLAPDVSILGDVLPGRHPEVADAVTSGTIGVESARIIASTVDGMRRRVEPEAMDRMVASLLQLAASADPEAVRDRAATWSLAIDPDGDEPRERTQRRKRALRFRQTLTDGTTTATLVLPPEDLAFLRELLAAQRRGRPLIRTEAGGDDDPDGDGPEWRPEGDDRTRPQHDFDTLMDALRAGATATEPAPPMHETVVTVTAAELEAREGRGWTPGVLAGIPIPVIERRACTGGMRLQVTGDRGEILHHGTSRRLFSPAQRRALSVHAGGRCQFPGCRVPDPYLEAHHVEWWHRDGGPTDVGNGMMLCSFHHHLVHAGQSPVRIEHHEGAQHIVPRSWLGPPAAHHRVRTGPPFGGSGPPT